MYVTMETQRLITVSLGKIAQSRCKRGGINLHKNLLVATVLHKARTAFMIESHSYQQTLHLQKLQHQHLYQPCGENNTGGDEEFSSMVEELNKGDVCQTSFESNLGHATLTAAQAMSDFSTEFESAIPESTPIQESEPVMLLDKENSPPSTENRLLFPENVPNSATKPTEQFNHINASNQLFHDAQLTITSSSTNTTCKVLKRQRHNHGPSICSEYEYPLSKKAKLSCELSSYSSSYGNTDLSNVSSDDSEEELDTTDSPQISNLVSIFNAGFSGLCVASNDSSSFQSSCDSDFTTSSHHAHLNTLRSESPSFSRTSPEPSLLCSTNITRFEPLPSNDNGLTCSESQGNNDISHSHFINRLRSESPTPAFSRISPEASLLCSTQINRLESLPSAIVLSA